MGKSGVPMPWLWTEGNTQQGATRESCCDPARSETLSMSGSCLHRSWEVSSVSDGVLSGGAWKGNRNPTLRWGERSEGCGCAHSTEEAAEQRTSLVTI